MVSSSRGTAEERQRAPAVRGYRRGMMMRRREG
jgi:hypothetical protein